jgi:transcriptional regulator with XRE-family HTH domain
MNVLTTLRTIGPTIVKNQETNGFGARLAELRKSRGLTQTQLGEAVGSSKRVIAYYETDGGQPPGPMLPNLADALGVSIDELLGTKPIKKKESPKTARLINRLRKVEQLSPTDQRAVLKYIDTLYQRKQLSNRQRSNGARKSATKKVRRADT